MGNFENLPSDILLDIITLLPTESILDSKLVCKHWRNVSRHPAFSQLHLARLNDSGKLCFLVSVGSEFKFNQLYHFEYNENNGDTPIHSTRRFNLTPPFTSHYDVVGSFNGLVCLYGYRENTACICNPVTREYVMLPKLKRDCDNEYIQWSSGFGYLPSSDEYKVVEMYMLNSKHDFVEVAVYTLGSGNGWRNVGRLDANKVNADNGVLAKGVLHWLNEGGNEVLAFNLAEEKFQEHLSPPPFPPDYMMPDYMLGVLGGDLYYSVRESFLSRSYAHIWLHDALGWKEVYALLRKQPLAYTKSGRVLCFSDNSIGIYHGTTSKTLVDFGEFSQVIPHRNTLVSLKELGEAGIQIMESAETESRDLLTKQLAS